MRFLNKRFRTKIFNSFNKCSYAEAHFSKSVNLENDTPDEYIIQIFEINFASSGIFNTALNTINKVMISEKSFYSPNDHIQASVAFFKKEKSIIILWDEYDKLTEFYSCINVLKKDYTLFYKDLD